jgi:hypothetical protein
MICTTPYIYRACQELFARYPLAAETAYDGGNIVSSMVLMLQDRDDAQFFLLSHRSGDDTSPYSLGPWPKGDLIEIGPDYKDAAPDATLEAVTCGVPIPRDGSIFGWTHRDNITALIAIYTKYTPESPIPSWTVMPLAGIPEAQWPPFVNERFFGSWFWEHYRVRTIALLDDLIAETPDTFYWVDTRTILGSDCCVVARNLMGPDGYTLRRGRYVYYQALRAGKPVPTLTVLLADAGKIDLAPRFQ